jgi:hypothetical protein
LPVKVEGLSSHVWTCEGHLTRVGYFDFQHCAGGDCGRPIARLLLNDRWVSYPEQAREIAGVEIRRRVVTDHIDAGDLVAAAGDSQHSAIGTVAPTAAMLRKPINWWLLLPKPETVPV